MAASRPWQGVSRDHPARLLDPQDPLALLKEFRATRARMKEMAAGSPQPRIGYACMWEQVPERTWSYSAWNLRAALRLAADTTDIGVQIPRLPRTILRAVHARHRAGRLTTTWEFSRLTDAYIEHALRRELSRNPAARRCDAVLTIQATSPPCLSHSSRITDISWDTFAEMTGGADASAALLSMTPSSIARRRERQRVIYERATGVIVESRWLARTLVEQTGVPPGKVHVVPPGISGRVGAPERQSPRQPIQ